LLVASNTFKCSLSTYPIAIECLGNYLKPGHDE
jgi:hypothetical protein